MIVLSALIAGIFYSHSMIQLGNFQRWPVEGAFNTLGTVAVETSNDLRHVGVCFHVLVDRAANPIYEAFTEEPFEIFKKSLSLGSQPKLHQISKVLQMK